MPSIHSKFLTITVAGLLLGACATNTSKLDVEHSGEATAVATTDAGALTEFQSIAAARQHAIDHANESLEEGSDTTSVIVEEDVNVEDDAGTTIASLTDKQELITIDTDVIAAEPVTQAQVEAELTSAEDAAIAQAIAEARNNIWHRVRAGFALPDIDHPGIRSERNWYAKNQSYLDRTFSRAAPYFHLIVEEVERRGMPMEIALLPVVESAFQPFAYSHGRASGIWQFIPGTARRFKLKIDWWYDGRRDIPAATHAALDYLQYLHKHFDGDWLLALAAYNSGEGRVGKAVRKNKKKGLKTTFWDLKLPRETRGYVPKLLAISAVVNDPASFNVSLKKIANEPYLAEVNIGSQLDLAIAAEMASISLEELYTLNPAFNRWATSPDGPHHLLLPLDKVDGFKQKLAQLPADQRVKWVRHKIGDGETLGHIAKRYDTTVSNLKRINKIRSHMIRAGKHLLIPVASRDEIHYAKSEDQRLKAKQNAPRKGNKLIHTVQNGDTFWDLSRAYKVSVRSLASWNNMAPTDTLRLKQKLVVWSKSEKALSGIDTPVSNPMNKAITQKINYKVRNGDSLARISQRFNVSVNKLKKWNPSARGKYIQPGQRLVVYVDVTNISENI